MTISRQSNYLARLVHTLKSNRLSFSFIGTALVFALIDRTQGWWETTQAVRPSTRHAFTFDTVTESLPLSWEKCLLLFSYWGCVVGLGVQTLPLFLPRQSRRMSRILAGIVGLIPAYLVIISVNRAITLFVSNRYAPTLCFLSLISICIMARIWLRNAGVRRSSKLANWKQIGILALALVFFLVSGIQMGGQRLAGDGLLEALATIRTQLESLQSNPNGFLPRSGEHYDEWLFNYPTLYSRIGNTSPETIFWILASLGRLSAILFAHSLLRELGVGRKLAAAATLYLAIGTPSLNITRYELLFDAGNPWLYDLHIGRLIGDLVPTLFTLSLFRRDSGKNFFQKFILLCFGAGLASTSVSNSLFLVVAITFGTIYLCLKSGNSVTPFLSRRMKVIPLWASINSLIVGLTISAPKIVGRFGSGTGMLLSSAVGVLAMPLVSSREFLLSRKTLLALRGIWPLLVGLLISALFFGNRGTVLLFRAIGLGDSSFFSRHLPNPNSHAGPWFEWQTCTFTSFYCDSVIGFVASYGLIFLICPLTLYLATRSKRPSYPLIYFSGLSISVLTLAMFVMHFKKFTIWMWLLTRLVEVPYYTVFFCFIVAAQRSSRQWRREVPLLLVLWSVIPFVFTDKAKQLYWNFCSAANTLFFNN